MQFKLKELVIFFVVSVCGSFAGNFVIDFFGLSTGEGYIGMALGLFVPVLIIYLVWKNWGQKASA